jgi:hypothetical protein
MPFPVSAAPVEQVPYTDLISWGKLVFYSWLKFMATTDTAPANFASSTVELSLQSVYSNLTVETWL